MNELDCERERRWKSEQATRKLLDTIKALQDVRFSFPVIFFTCNFLLLNTNTVLGRMKNIKIRSQQMNNMRGFGRFGTICTIQKTWRIPMEEYYF